MEKQKRLEYAINTDGDKKLLENAYQASFGKAIIRAFFWPNFKTACINFVDMLIFRVLQPVLLGNVIKYFKSDNKWTDEDKNSVLMYATLLIVCNAMNSLLWNFYMRESESIGMRVRVSSSALIYKKVLFQFFI